MKIQKTEAEYNMRSIRFLLLTITTMFLFVSILMIVLGISVYYSYHDMTFLSESGSRGSFYTPSVMVVFLGVVMMVVTCFGFFGSLRESTCMVNLYALILFLVMIVELAVVILAFTMDPARLASYININIQLYATDPEIEAEIDFLQTNLNCCGSEHYTDFQGLEWQKHHNVVFWSPETDSIVLPESCCVDPNMGYCSRIRQNNCTNALVNMILQNSSVIGVLGVSVLFIQILGITFALLLARAIRKLKSERGLRRWNERERMIFEREARKAKESGVFWADKAGSTEA